MIWYGALLHARREYQSHTYVNMVFYARQADVATHLYIVYMDRVPPFPKSEKTAEGTDLRAVMLLPAPVDAQFQGH